MRLAQHGHRQVEASQHRRATNSGNTDLRPLHVRLPSCLSCLPLLPSRREQLLRRSQFAVPERDHRDGGLIDACSSSGMTIASPTS
jgi:hypothetical protein